MLYFFLKVPDWSSELVEKQNVFLEVIRLADDMAIRFAFPTQSIHVESMPPEGGMQQDQLDINRLRQVAQSYGPQGQAARPAGQGVFVPPYKEGSQ
jgi:MscS family membrane protein